ncbi:MAG TPA: RNA 2',3'-cyclic phosphodiesterase [Bacteroidia bacterium]|jgi:2'-5' RNA ligase|nr:RNA 2',3'-cyclic phosphodiesterase [Bacteroidia bacterium]
MTTLYFVASVVPAGLNEQISVFKNDLSRKFGTKAALKAPAHITLYSPFHYHPENESLLKEALKDCSGDISSFPVQLKNFSCFPPRVIFIGVEPSEELIRLQKKVKDRFMHVPEMKGRKEQEFHPHMTIANRDWTEEQFDEAWEEYSAKEFTGSYQVDRIALLRLDEGKWNIIAETDLKSVSL